MMHPALPTSTAHGDTLQFKAAMEDAFPLPLHGEAAGLDLNDSDLLAGVDWLSAPAEFLWHSGEWLNPGQCLTPLQS